MSALEEAIGLQFSEASMNQINPSFKPTIIMTVPVIIMETQRGHSIHQQMMPSSSNLQEARTRAGSANTYSARTEEIQIYSEATSTHSVEGLKKENNAL